MYNSNQERSYVFELISHIELSVSVIDGERENSLMTVPREKQKPR